MAKTPKRSSPEDVADWVSEWVETTIIMLMARHHVPRDERRGEILRAMDMIEAGVATRDGSGIAFVDVTLAWAREYSYTPVAPNAEN